MFAPRTLAMALPLVLAPHVIHTPYPDALVPAAVAGPAATAALVGPPWISIEYPVNPYDATTKGAFLVVHAFHHGTPTAFPVSGSAEGIVNGERRSVPLRFATTSRTGTFALTRQWPNEGTWTLVVSVAQGPEDRVSAIVDLTRSGDVAAIRVPTRQHEGHTLPAAVAMSEVEQSLRQRAAQLSAVR
ncbi:MAG: hypothetical protein IPP20_10330 [Gemmatimonadetes bacterium]|nr:hypothetical protein [Gemmatimonadota bacterium]